MDARIVSFLLGRMAFLEGAALFLAFGLAIFWADEHPLAFGVPAALSFVLWRVFSHLSKGHRHTIGVTDGAVFLFAAWLLNSLLGALPFFLTGELSAADSFFASVAAFTTTALLFTPTGLESSLGFWQIFQGWIGGMYFLCLLVTIMPQVGGCFGLTLSVQQGTNFSPLLRRMNAAARKMALLYACLTLLALGLFLLAGESFLSSAVLALTSISTTGLDPRGLVLKGSGVTTEVAAEAAMLLAGVNFLLWQRAAARRDVRTLFADAELRFFLLVVCAGGAALACYLAVVGVYDVEHSLRMGFFHAISFATTTGFAAAPLASWPTFPHAVLLLLATLGSSVGAVGGGFKAMRLLVLIKMAKAEILRTIHPRMIVNIKIDGKSVPHKLHGRILSFFFLYVVVLILATLGLALAHIDTLPAMGFAVGCLSGTGTVVTLLYGGKDFLLLPGWVKVFAGFLMILGRLEIFSFLILLRAGIDRLHKRQW